MARSARRDERGRSTPIRNGEVVDATNDRVVAEITCTARGAGSAVGAGFRFWPILWFADGLVVMRVVYWTRDEALNAAGLSE